MAGSLNKVMLIGNLGQDPDIRTMTSGDEVATLSIATSESWTDKQSGEKKERTQWHKIVIFNAGLVKVAKNYLTKGSKIYIEGTLETRKWTDKEGKDQYTTEVVLRPYNGELLMLDGKGAASDGGSSNGYGGQSSYGGSSKPATKADEMSDDIPF